MKYQLTKRCEVAGAHRLGLSYKSPCENLHGHNWIIHVSVEGSCLDINGMLIDFKHIKEVVNRLDHANINEVVSVNPTAENIAKWICNSVQTKINQQWDDWGNDSMELIPNKTSYEDRPKVYKVTVQESEGNVACYMI